jgi:hypothetical protein
MTLRTMKSPRVSWTVSPFLVGSHADHRRFADQGRGGDDALALLAGELRRRAGLGVDAPQREAARGAILVDEVEARPIGGPPAVRHHQRIEGPGGQVVEIGAHRRPVFDVQEPEFQPGELGVARDGVGIAVQPWPVTAVGGQGLDQMHGRDATDIGLHRCHTARVRRPHGRRPHRHARRLVRHHRGEVGEAIAVVRCPAAGQGAAAAGILDPQVVVIKGELAAAVGREGLVTFGGVTDPGRLALGPAPAPARVIEGQESVGFYNEVGKLQCARLDRQRFGKRSVVEQRRSGLRGGVDQEPSPALTGVDRVPEPPTVAEPVRPDGVVVEAHVALPEAEALGQGITVMKG